MLRRIEVWVQKQKSNIQLKNAGEKSKHLMAGNDHWVEWYVEVAVAGGN